MHMLKDLLPRNLQKQTSFQLHFFIRIYILLQYSLCGFLVLSFLGQPLWETEKYWVDEN